MSPPPPHPPFQSVETDSDIVILCFVPQDPDEDEDMRQYRLKIEEQKRLREEILKRKELRRQMQAGVRKKELLDRINSQTTTPNQGPAPSQTPPAQQNQQTPHPIVQQQPPPPQPLQQQEQQQQQQQQLQPQQQRTQQSVNQSLKNPNQGPLISPNGAAQTPTPRPNIKARLQMVKGNSQQQQTLGPGPGPGPDQQWKQPQQNQQQPPLWRNSALQNVNRPGAQIQSPQVPQKNIPVTSSVGPGQTQVQGPKPGAKRTVMQRAKICGGEGQQVPQKVRVVKLSGAVSIRFHFYLTPSFGVLSDIYFIPFQLIFTHMGNDIVL